MKIRFRCVDPNKTTKLNEKTYTINGVQYWKRMGKFCKWTEQMGRVEISEDEYLQALASMSTKATPSTKDVSKKEPRKVEEPKNYKEAKPEDLVILAKNGNKKAEEEILKRYQPLVHKIANKYFIQGGDHDDLFQDGMIAVWEAIQGYDEEKNDNFNKFLGMAIDNRLKVSVRDNNTNKASVLNQATSMDVTATGGDGGDDEGRTLGETLPSKGPSIEEDMLGKEGANRLTDFIKNLPEKERLAITGIVDGKKISEVAEDLGVSYKTVENAVMRARNKIRDYMKMEESRKRSSELERVNEGTHDDDLDESSFDLDGITYTSKWGVYYRGKSEITKDEYHQAMDQYKNLKVEDDEGNLFNASNDTTIDRVDRFKEFYKSGKYEDYSIDRDTRGHLAKIDKDDKASRVNQIKADINCDNDKAEMINDVISTYTAVDSSKITGEQTYALEEYISKAPVYDKVPLFRGMGFKKAYQDDDTYFDQYKEMNVGDRLPLIGITSTTSNPDVACNFAEANGENLVMIVISKNLSGVSIDHLVTSRYNEGEVLFSKDTNFKVVRKDVTDDTIYLEVQEVEELGEDINVGAHVVDQDMGNTLKPEEFNESKGVDVDVDVDESSFVLGGNTYSAAFGRYSRDGEPIKAEEYHDAREKYDDTGIMSKATKVADVEINDVLEDLDIDVEEAPVSETRGKRGHLENVSRGENNDSWRVLENLCKDLNVNEKEGHRCLDALHRYTIGSHDYDDEDRDVIEDLVSKLPVYQDGLLYRGMTFYVGKGAPKGDTADWYVNECKEGDVLKLRGLTSFTSNYKVAKGFNRGGGSSSLMNVMIINSRNLTGPSINHLSDFEKDEQEILYSKDAKFQVKARKQIGNTIYLHVQEQAMNENNDVVVHTLEVEGNLHSDKEKVE